MVGVEGREAKEQPMVSSIIFDMDGTLVDTEVVSQAAWDQALRRAGVENPAPIRRSFIGCNVVSNSRTLAGVLGSEERVHEVYKDHDKTFAELSRTELVAKPGARETLEALRADGYRMALATSTSREPALARLARFNLDKMFDAMVCGDEIEHGKPDPEIFLRAAAALDVKPELCVVVEDSLNGVRAGHAAGMHVIMVPDLVEPTEEITGMCDAVVDTLFEVEGAVKRL